MAEPEFMKIHKKYFSNELPNKYNLRNKRANNGYIYCRIKKGMYGLKQAAQLAYDDLDSSRFLRIDAGLELRTWSCRYINAKFCQ